MDEWGSRNGVSLSEEAQCRGPLGKAPLLGTHPCKERLQYGHLSP